MGCHSALNGMRRENSFLHTVLVNSFTDLVEFFVCLVICHEEERAVRWLWLQRSTVELMLLGVE